MTTRNRRIAVLTASTALLLAPLASPSYADPPPSDDGLGFVHADRSADEPAPRRTARATPVDARVGTLTTRPAGLPDGTGSRRLASAKVKQDLVKDRVEATIVLDQAPGPEAHVFVEFGRQIDSTCHGEATFSSPTATPTAGFSRSGRTITMRIASDEAGYETWDCAFVVLAGTPDGTPVYDALIGELVDVLAKPVLKLGKPTLLDKAKQPIRLVRGVWTVVEVPVQNTSRADALNVKITGKGKGVKVKKVTIPKVWPEGRTSVRVKVKLTKAGKSKLKLSASTAQVKGTRTVKLKSVAAPKRAASGNYRTKNGDVRFQVKGGKIVGFRATTLQTCGGYPDFPTYNQVTLDFPKTAIGRNGIVDRVQTKELYTVSLQLRISGGKVTAGKFNYYGPNRCWAAEAFSMKR